MEKTATEIFLERLATRSMIFSMLVKCGENQFLEMLVDAFELAKLNPTTPTPTILEMALNTWQTKMLGSLVNKPPVSDFLPMPPGEPIPPDRMLEIAKKINASLDS